MKKYLALFLLLPIFSSCGTQQKSQENTGEPTTETVMSAGQRLFINNCVQCHNVKEDRTGPKLEGVLTRWDNDTARIRAFIHNSQEIIMSGHNEYATKLYHKWNDVTMPPFTNLSDGEINDIIGYISHPE